MLQTVFERAPRAGDVKALEAASCLAEDVARIKPEVGVIDDDIVEFFIRQAVSRKVQPEKIGAFRLDEFDLRHMLCEESLRFLVIAFDVGEKLFEPFGSVFIGCLGGEKTERIGLAVTGCRDFSAEFLAQLGIFDEDVRDLQAGE